MSQPSFTYRDAGVSRDAGAEAVERIKAHCRSTFSPHVLTDLGLFGALFQFDAAAFRELVLVSSTDGVGTKLKVACKAGKHDTIGIDLVAMCVNDVLAQGAKPLFFLDYLVTGKVSPAQVEEIIKGMAEGCRQAGCALIGGEIAEHPGDFPEGEYDLAGFVVGVVEKSRIINGATIQPGDVILGLPSSGLHSNGYSLARKLLFEVGGYDVDTHLDELGCTVGEELLKPTQIYVPSLLPLLEPPNHQATEPLAVKGLAHITGGGLLDNIPRLLPPGTKAVIERGTWPEPPIFGLLQRLGNVPTEEMFRTFNMGVGMVVVVDAGDSVDMKKRLDASGCPCSRIGKVAGSESAPFVELA